MKKTSLLMMFAVGAIIVLSNGMLVNAAETPEQQFLRQRADKQLEAMRESGRNAFRGLLLYPQDVREAIMEISQHPELVVKVLALGDKPGEKLAEVIEPYPKEVQESAKLMSGYPDVLSILQENLVVTGLLGAVYADDKPTIQQMVNRLASKVEQENTQAVDDWAKRLENNPEAIEELNAAKQAYEKEFGHLVSGQPVVTSGPDTSKESSEQPSQININISDQKLYYGQYYCDDYGYNVSADGSFAVHDTPCYDFDSYVLAYPHYYPHLSGELLEHYREHREQPGDLYQAAKDWFEERPHIQEKDFLKDDGRRLERLQEQGQFDEEFAKVRKTRGNLDRRRFLSENAERFPNLSAQVDKERARTQIAERHRPERGVRPGVQQKRPSYEPVKRQVTQKRRRTTTPSKQKQIRRQKPTRNQQISRAQRSHRSTWQQTGRRTRSTGRRQGRGGRRR